ncbi:MAG: putative iron-sulfur cluster-binding metallochaperone [Planctomycetota bacterium]
METKQILTGVGSGVAALVASACCWLPLVLLAIGAGATAVGTVTNAIETFRPVFAVVALGFLGAAWYFTYFRRPVRASTAGAEACCTEGLDAVPEAKGAVSTEGCCATKMQEKAQEALCSCCTWKGKRVPASTVRALVRADLRDRVRDGDYVLCLNPGCAQVYTGPAGARPFVKSDLTVRVGYKETDGPHLVCYCFEHSVEDIEKELRTAGKTTIPERIRIEVKDGHCECEVKNPQGTCCLGNVNRAVKEAEARIAGGIELKVAPVVQCGPASLP